MAQRVLITGGAGFIGSHVGHSFLDRGWDVHVVDNFSTGKRKNLPSAATIYELDIGSPECARLVENDMDVVVHLAAQMDVRKSLVDPVFDAATNIIGTLNIAEATRRAAKRPRLVFASTGGVLYGDFVTPPNEETFPKDPESPYAISKLSAEYYLAYYGRVHGLEAVSLRFGNVYGPRQDPHGEAGVVAIFCGRILDGHPLRIYGDGAQTRDYVYVEDVARAAFLAATTSLPPMERLDSRSFNIGTGRGTSVNDLAETLQRVAGVRVAIEYAPERRGEQRHSFVNTAKAATQLGWRPTVSLDAGLSQTFRWFSAQSRHPGTAGHA